MDSTQLDLIRLKKLLSVTYILVKIVLTQLTLGTLVTFGLKRNWDNFTSALSWYVRQAVRHIVVLLPVFCIISVNMEEWRQCGRWLIDCKVLPPNHRVVWPSAVVFDLAQALRDGVLLCQMLHNLSPGSVDLKQINFRPQMSQVS